MGLIKLQSTQRYNARAKKLFENSVRSYSKRQEEEFKNLFSEMDDTRLPQGYVLLKPVKSREYDGTIAGYRAAVPTGNRQKRVRLSTIKTFRETFASVPVVPTSTDLARKDFDVPSNDIGALGCIPDVEYEVVYGNTSMIFDKTERCTIYNLAECLKRNTRPPRLHDDFDPERRFPFLLGDTFLRELDDIYGRNLQRLQPSDVISLLERIQRTCKTRRERFYNQLRDLSTILRPNAYLSEYHFVKWCLKSPLNVPIVFFSEFQDYTLLNMIGRCFDLDVLDNVNINDLDDVFDSFFSQFENRDNFDCFLTVGDLLRATKQTKFTDTLPSIDNGTSAGHPVAITESYNHLVSQPQSQMKFKLALTRHQGLNPAYFADEGDTNPLGVPNSDNHVDFDDDIKRFEFDLHAKDCRGYQEEFKATCRMLLQVLFTSSSPPDVSRMPKGSVFDILQNYEIYFTDREGQRERQGFIYVPQHFPDELRDNSEFMKNFRLSLIPAPSYEQIATYPAWDSRKRVSTASLYFWKNAMATVASPFSTVSESLKINNVAAVLALSEPFTSMKTVEKTLVNQLLKQITKEELFKDPDCLHLIQLTSGSMAPGITDFCQTFDPLVVHFKGAAIKQDRESKRFQLTYSLGTESTILIEAFMIATALVKILVANQGGDDRVPDAEPRSGMKVVRFPLSKDDGNFKREKLDETYTPEDIQGGYATTFSATGFHKECIDFDSYNRFINYGGVQVENKAGNVSWGENYRLKPDAVFNRILNGPGLIVPGNYIADNDDIIRHTVDRNRYNNIGTITRPFTREEQLAEIQRAQEEDRNPVPRFTERRDSQPMFRFPFTLANLGMTTYEDYIAYSIFGTRDGDIIFPGDNFRRISIPMYSSTTDSVCAYCTVTFDPDYAYEVRRRSPRVYVGLPDNALQFYISSIFIVDLSQFKVVKSRDEQDELQPQGDLHLGFLLSKQYTEIQTRRADVNFIEHFKWNDRLFFRLKTFYKGDLSAGVRGDSILRLSQNEMKKIETNKKSYFAFQPQPPFIKYTKKSTDTIDSQAIVKLIKDGCQGYHFSRRDALSRTVFAVAINDTKKKIQEWYQDCDGTLPGDLGREHRGIHIINPDRHHQNCAKLLNLILRHEMKGSATLGQMATTGKHLITPVIVNVLGPMESSLLTPCYVDNVFAKTARFRSVEAQIIGMIESHLDMIRRVDVVKGRVRNCLAEHIMRHKPRSIESCKWMIDKKPSVIPTMATLFIR